MISKISCRYIFTAFTIVTTLLVFNKLGAHEIRPAYLEINELSENLYAVKWKLPVLQGRIPLIQPELSNTSGISNLKEDQNSLALVQTYQLTTSSSIGGSKLQFTNLEKTLIDVVVNINLLSGEKFMFLVQPNRPQIVIPASQASWQVARTFGILGIEHILFGWDHLLFVLALVLLIRDKIQLLKTITAFTIAHSLTLIGTSMQWMSLPAAPVETIIALSVVFVAREIVMVYKGKESITQRRPWLIAFTFGLLHGFGFAGALSEIGLPEHALFSALLSFNLGVEAGQIIFVIFIVFLTILINKMFRLRNIQLYNKLIGYGIGSIASFWFLTRLFDIVA